MGLNIRQLAEKAGVSISTVSRATNPDTREMVAPSTLKVIDKFVKKYSYTANIAAKHLSTTSTKTLGVVFPAQKNIFYNSYYNHILSAISNSLLDTDYQFKLILLEEKNTTWDNFNFQTGEAVDGLIITNWLNFFTPSLISKRINIPFVIINDYQKDLKASFICADNFSGGQKAAQYLYSMGHRNVAAITGPTWSISSQQRVEGFVYHWQRICRNFPQKQLFTGDFNNPEMINAIIDQITQSKSKITGIYCITDEIAFTAINRLKQFGFECPRDISVIGFDDDLRSENFSPALTTINVPTYDMAQVAVETLLSKLMEEDYAPREEVEWIPVKLMERNSVRDIGF